MGHTPSPSAHQAAEHVARESFGRLVSWLAWQWRDLGAAEDALGDALLKALERWPVDGVPDAPQAWLLAVARRQLLQAARHDKVRFDPAVQVLLAVGESGEAPAPVADARLRLLFVCAHPAIDEKVRVPLMLQAVLGLQVAEMAPALLTSPTALAQRLVRAKQKIRDTGLRFEEPEARELPQRLHHVLEALYGAFGLSLDAVDGAEPRVTDLQQEAIYLATLVCQLLPEAAEAKGLLALMGFCQARRAARTDAQGRFVPLTQQDVSRWDREAIVQAEQCLWEAAKARQPGPFQWEAAVQSAHCHRLFTGTTPWQAIAQLYEQIDTHWPTQGARIAGAVALAESGDVAGALQRLEGMDPSAVRASQPWWVARAHLLARSGRIDAREAAEAAYDTAIGLSSQKILREHLMRCRRALGAGPESMDL